MPLFTSGKVAATPLRIENVAADLAGLRDALNARQPNSQKLLAGWLGPAEDERIHRFASAPGHSVPAAVLPADSRTPERLIARYYYWVYDRVRAELLSGSAIQNHYRLEAVDVLLTIDASNQVLALVSSRSEDVVSTTIHALQTAIHSAEIDRFHATSLHLGDPDFFLWAMEWIINGAAIGEVSPTEATSLRARDKSSKPSLIMDTVDAQRNVFLNAVASGDTLDQLRFVVRISSIPAKITAELYIDGSFVILTSGSHYGIHANVTNEHLRSVEDVAYFLIPLLRGQYERDADWRLERKSAFEVEARRTLIERLSAGLP